LSASHRRMGNGRPEKSEAMGSLIEEKFLALAPDQTRCPDRVRELVPTAARIYLLRQRFDCRHWDRVRDCFHKVVGGYIVTEPKAGRQYFTVCPETVVQRLREAGVWSE
jgi:hypothetical protein